MRKPLAILCILLAAASASAVDIPEVELQALDRAIKRELADDKLGSQTLGDLQRLKYRLDQVRGQSKTGALAELEPLDAASPAATLSRLERDAESGSRPALRALALYHLYQNDPESALRAWRRMGEATPGDLAYQLLASYLELALGDHNAARLHLETAGRLINSRTGLELSKPVFSENIAGYRLYAPLPKKDILPGDTTLLYVEIDGADFQPLAEGDYECRIMFGMKLKNEQGGTLWADPNYGEYAPIFNGPIRDLHTALTWRVPNDLQPGLYTLIVEAEEQPSLRRGETSMEFTVAKRPTNPEPKLDAGQRQQVNKALQDANKMFPGATPQFQNFDTMAPGSTPRSPMVEQFMQSEEGRTLFQNWEQLKGGMEQ
jgi:hypothetical protein